MAEARLDYQVAVGAYLEEAGDGSSSFSSPSSGSGRDGDSDRVDGPVERDGRVSDDAEEEHQSLSEVCTFLVSL